MKTLEQVINGDGFRKGSLIDIPIECADGHTAWISVNYNGFISYLLKTMQECYYSETDIMVIENTNRYKQ